MTRRRLPIVDGIQLMPPSGPHRIGAVVPPGGSHCTNCIFLRNGRQCSLVLWVMAPRSKFGGGGSTFIPVAAREWCCDGWEDARKMRRTR